MDRSDYPQSATSTSRWGLSRAKIALVLVVALIVLLIIGAAGFFTFIKSHAPAALTSRPSSSTSPTAISMFGLDPQHTRFDPDEHILTPSTVSRLVPAWTSLLTGGSISSSP